MSSSNNSNMSNSSTHNNNKNALFALVDCNNFYASCERVFNPKLNGKPIIVLSGNDGCVIARSNESKALGIKMGEPYFQIRPQVKKHHVRVFSSNFALYGDMSERVMNILLSSAPSVEIYSIDEAFLDFTGFDFFSGLHTKANSYHNHVHPCPEQYAHFLVKKIYQWTGLPVSIGIGSSKTLAKVANYWAKKYAVKDNVLDISSVLMQENILPKVPISEIWGIGRGWSEKLNKLGIKTAWDLRNADANNIGKRFNRVLRDTVLELRGMHQIALEEIPRLRKQIIVSRSFGQKITNLAHIKSALTTHVCTAAEKLREEGLKVQVLTVFLQTSSFIESTAQYHNSVTISLPTATAHTTKLIIAANKGLESIYRKKYAYKKVGIILSNLTLESEGQSDLFSEDSPCSKSLMNTLDIINEKMGKGAVRYAREGFEKVWLGAKTWCSPRYTTCWQELLRVSGGLPHFVKDYF